MTKQASPTCAFPACRRHPEKNGFCIGHQGYTKQTIEPAKRIEKRGKKMQSTVRDLKKAAATFLITHRTCEIRSPVCTGKATVVNHTRRRGANVLNQADWQASCAACNGYIEANDKWAREHGHLKSIHKSKDHATKNNRQQ